MSTHAAVEPEPSLSQFLQQQDLDKVKHFSLSDRRYNLRFGNSRQAAIMHVGLAMSEEHMYTPFLEIFVYHADDEVTVHLVLNKQLPESLCYRAKIKSAVTSNVVNTVLGLLRSLPSKGRYRTCLEELVHLHPEPTEAAAEPDSGISGVFAHLHRQLPRAENALRVRTGVEEYPVAYLYTIPTKDGRVRVQLQRPRAGMGYLYMADLTEDDAFVRLERVTHNSVVAVFDTARSAADLARKIAVAAAINHSRKRVQAAAEPPQDPRQVLCDRLKAKYNLELDPELITYIGKDGIDYNGDVSLGGRNLTRIPVRFRSVTGNFYCFSNKLTTLENAPFFVGGDFNCSNNSLLSLKHAPRHLGRDFDCSSNRLVSLEHAPTHIDGSFRCSNNQLVTLKYAPGYVGRDFYCDGNMLTSLKYVPAHVGSRFNCRSNQLTTLDYVPSYVGSNFFCEDNHLPADTKKPDSVRKAFFHLGAQKPAVLQAAAEPPHKLSAFDFAADLHARMRDGAPVRIGKRLFLMFSSRREDRDFVQLHFQIPGDPGEVRVNVHDSDVVQATVYIPPRIGRLCSNVRAPDLEHGPAPVMLKKFLTGLKINCNTDQFSGYDNVYELLEKLPGLATSVEAAAEPEPIGNHVATPDEVAEILFAHHRIRPNRDIRFNSTIRLVYDHVTVAIDLGEPDDPQLRELGADAVVVALWCGPLLLWAREVDDAEQVRSIGLSVAAAEAALSKKADPEQKARVLLEIRRRWAPKAGPVTQKYISDLHKHLQDMEATAAAEPEPKPVRMHLFDNLVELVPGTKRVVVDGAEVSFGRLKLIAPVNDTQMFVHVTTPAGTTKFRVYENFFAGAGVVSDKIDLVMQEQESMRKLWLHVHKAQNTRQLLAGIVKYAVLAHKAPFPGGHEVEI